MYHKSKHISFGQIILHFILGAFTLICVAPIVLVVIVSFSSGASVDAKGFSFFPDAWSLEAWKYVGMYADQLINGYVVTISKSVVGTLWSILITSMAGYALSRQQFRLRNQLTVFLLIAMLFEGNSISHYLVKSAYGLRDNPLVWILPGVGAYGVIVMRTFIRSNVPDSLVESAKMDGAGEFLIYTRIIVPLIIPILAANAFMQFVGHWNEWYNSFLFISKPELTPLQLILIRIENNLTYLTNNMATLSATQLEELKRMPTVPTRMAILLVVLGPILIIYPFFQKYFIKGMIVGAVKE